jgi:hypothetical protein
MEKNKNSPRVLNRLNIKCFPNSKLAQVWIETAIYTLIGLTIIAILLAVANPQIDKIKDKGMVNQATDALNTLDSKVLDVSQSVGSVAVPNIKVGKGKFIINSSNDSIGYVLSNSILQYSQIGFPIKEGNFIVETEKSGNKFNIFITRYYSGVNITYNGSDSLDKYLEAGPVPYKIRMENKGRGNIDFDIIG